MGCGNTVFGSVEVIGKSGVARVRESDERWKSGLGEFTGDVTIR